MRIARPSGDMELRAPRIRLPRAAASSVLSRHWLSPARTLEPRIVSMMAVMRVIVSRPVRATWIHVLSTITSRAESSRTAACSMVR